METGSTDAFSRLSSPMQAALLYHIGPWTQQQVFARFSVSYGQYRSSRDRLIADAFLEAGGAPTQKAFDQIPTRAWVEIRSALMRDLATSRGDAARKLQENTLLQERIQDLTKQVEGLAKANTRKSHTKSKAV